MLPRSGYIKIVHSRPKSAFVEYGEPLVRRLIEKVTVYSGKQVAADKFTVEFKSGVTVDVDE